MNEKIEQVLTNFKDEVKKHTTFEKSFITRLIKIIEKNKDSMIILNNKFKFDTIFFSNFIKDIDKNKDDSYYYKNFNRLKKFNIIHKSSSYFPKNLSLISINPNHISLLIDNFKLIDTFYNEIIEVRSKLHLKEYLYLYLRLFHIYPMTQQQLASIKINNIINLEYNKTVLALIHKTFKINKHDKLINLLRLDSYASEIMNNHTNINSNELLFKDIQVHEEFVNNYKKIYLDNENLSVIKMINRNYYLLTSSSLKLTLNAKIENTVKLTISELNKIYPNRVPKHLLEIEEEQIKIIFEKNDKYNDNEDNQESCIDIREIEELDEFLKQKDNTPSTKLTQNVIKSIQSYIKMNEKNESYKIILTYILSLINKLEKRKLRLSTVKNYIGILNKHIFTKFEDLYNIKNNEIDNFIQRIDSLNYKRSSVKKVLRLTLEFFRFSRIEHGLNIEIPLLYYPKSLILRNEIDLILDEIQIDYIKKYNMQRLGKNHSFIILQKKILVLLGFYTGMRISELKSRLFQDIYMYEDTLYVDVNIKGLRKLNLKLKRRSAKRRIKTIIKNKKHLVLIKQWYALLEKSKKKGDFIFTTMNNNLTMSKSSIDDSEIVNITNIIKKITRRYCTFHSLRHSFATYKVDEILKYSTDNPYDLIELSMIMGHETPRTTLNSYVHHDLIELLF